MASTRFDTRGCPLSARKPRGKLVANGVCGTCRTPSIGEEPTVMNEYLMIGLGDAKGETKASYPGRWYQPGAVPAAMLAIASLTKL